MYRRNINDGKKHWLYLVCLIGIVMATSFSLASGDHKANGVDVSNDSKPLLDRIAPQMREQILEAATQPFKPSLEMKENVDFLLTPALLVQQVISEDIVITYPSE